MLDIKGMARGFAWNLLIACSVFIPVFLVASAIELRLRGGPPLEGELSYHVASGAVVYVTMLIPIALAAIVHSAALLLLPRRWSKRMRRVAALLLAPLVPVTVVVLRLPGEGLLSFLVGASSVATVAFGVACTTRVGMRADVRGDPLATGEDQ